MQHKCNKHATVISDIQDIFQGTVLWKMSFLYFIDGIDQFLRIKMCVHFFTQRHCTGVSHNFLYNCFIDIRCGQK